MGKEFFGMLMVDFETTKNVSDAKFKAFKKDYDKLVEGVFENMLYDLANKHGFDIENMHPNMESQDYILAPKG